VNDAAIRALSGVLAARADDETAQRTQRHVHTLRGVRGVPAGEVSRVLAAAAAELSISLPRDEAALSALFGTAWEDGLVAIGLLSTVAAAQPDDAAALALDWLDRTDDVATADALGWLVLGPAAGATGQIGDLVALRRHGRPEARRAAVSAALAWTPEPIEGPAAAALRAKVGAADLRMVDAPVTELLFGVCSRFARDEAPAVQKAMRRVLRAWAAWEPKAVVRWAETVKGGLPKMLGAVVQEARGGAG
jgi:hypothetical protein